MTRKTEYIDPAIMFCEYLSRWDLIPDGEPFITRTSRLLPVRQNGFPAMLKIAKVPEERTAGALMAWWNGDGAAPVLAYEEGVSLLARAEGSRSLAALAQSGGDDEASRIICSVIGRLHAPRDGQPPSLIPLSLWFRALEPAAEKYGGILARAAAVARDLLASPRDVVVLHGDIHHGNILDFGQKGWLAIDPNGLLGERAFDYANIFCNPDRETVSASGRLARQASLIAEAAGLERRRLLQWILAYAGLSAAWCLKDGESPDLRLEVATAAELTLAGHT